MSTIQKKMEAILLAREVRAIKQQELIDRYKTSLISFTLNIPGPDKNNPLYERVHHEGMKVICQTLKEKKIKMMYQETNIGTGGIEGFLCVDLDAYRLKKLMVTIENKHPLGRLFDIDVLDRQGNFIGRRQIGETERKCLLCDEKAVVCGRNKKHSLEALQNKIHQMVTAFFQFKNKEE